jgi:hypothetical protein
VKALTSLPTVWLRQKGSAESRPLDESEQGDEPTAKHVERKTGKRNGVARWLYANSLSLAFLLLFLMSFMGHLFLAVFSLIVLSIFLRQKDSPQSKKVDEPNSKTGT